MRRACAGAARDHLEIAAGDGDTRVGKRHLDLEDGAARARLQPPQHPRVAVGLEPRYGSGKTGTRRGQRRGTGGPGRQSAVAPQPEGHLAVPRRARPPARGQPGQPAEIAAAGPGRRRPELRGSPLCERADTARVMLEGLGRDIHLARQALRRRGAPARARQQECRHSHRGTQQDHRAGRRATLPLPQRQAAREARENRQADEHDATGKHGGIGTATRQRQQHAEGHHAQCADGNCHSLPGPAQRAS